MSATATTAPAVGDRVEITVTLMGLPVSLETVVVQVDDEGPRGVRLIVRPEDSVATFVVYDWRPVTPHAGQHLQGCVACYEAVGR